MQRSSSSTPASPFFGWICSHSPKIDVGMPRLHVERVVVISAHLVERQILGEAEIEDDLDALGAEIIRHLLFGVVARLGIPHLLLQRQLRLGAQRIAALGAPVRMDVEDIHSAITAP